jgi:hypothetical protein
MESAKDILENDILKIVNALIADSLPEINTAIDNEIKSEGLDPWPHVAGGTVSPGSINLGICHATVYASYNVGNLTGLSSTTINSLIITELAPKDDGFVGHVELSASLGKSFSGTASGSVGAKCGFIHPSVGLSGSVKVNSPSATANGTITIGIEGDKLCISNIAISAPHVSTGSITVSLSGLGIFDVVLDAIADAIVNMFKSQLIGLLASHLTPILNTEIGKSLPICKKL